jgi:hypothetical protein
MGEGYLALFHVTADPAWSNLPLTGIFPDMLKALSRLTDGGRDAREATTPLPLRQMLDGFGDLQPPGREVAPLVFDGSERAGPASPPGYYGATEASRALNVYEGQTDFAPIPRAVPVQDANGQRTRSLAPLFWVMAALFIAAEAVSAALAGGMLAKLRLPRKRASAAAGLVFGLSLGLAVLAHGPGAHASEEEAKAAALETRLAYYLTGNNEVDELSRAGLSGLSRVTRARTAAEPSAPVGVRFNGNHPTVLYPLIYWPVLETQEPLNGEQAERVNAYLRSGGAILFDTRDAGTAPPGRDTPARLALRRVMASLDVPPLAQVDAQHVLTKSFYLLDRFPGRWESGEVWVEASSMPSGEEEAGARSDDGVSSILIGSNDWAAAWALSPEGRFLRPISPGGNRQRELAFRFGINLIMYVLTGNYKQDQVHVAPLLRRLSE